MPGTAGDRSEEENSGSTSDYRQGDHLGIFRIPLSSRDDVDWLNTPEGVVIVSQTCDVVRQEPPYLLVAPVAYLDGTDLIEASAGKRPRFAAINALGGNAFADLSVIGSVDKADCASLTHAHGLITDEDKRKFGQAVGRKFSRFPFPNEVVPWFQPLQRWVRSKYAKPESPEGAAFLRVAELRVEADDGWTAEPYALTLVVILEPGELPVFEGDELPDMPEAIRGWLESAQGRRPAAEIAARLLAAEDPLERYWLWSALGEAWAARCRPTSQSLGRLSESEAMRTRSAVAGGEIGSEVLSADEYSYARYRRSVELDLDDLSDPLPR